MRKGSKRYWESELVNLSVDELRTIVKREAERINKQITRAKKRGIPAGLFTEKQLTAFPRNMAKKTRSEMIAQYARMKKWTPYELTVEGVKKTAARKRELQEQFNLSEDMAPEEFQSIHLTLEQAATENAMFYEVLHKAVLVGLEKDEQFFRTTNKEITAQNLTPEGRHEFMRQQLRRINQVIREQNKQQRDNPQYEREKLFYWSSAKKAARTRAESKKMLKRRK